MSRGRPPVSGPHGVSTPLCVRFRKASQGWQRSPSPSARRPSGRAAHSQVAAAHALAQMCQSNHANQELVADEGGLEVVVDVLQTCLQPLPPSPSPSATTHAASAPAHTNGTAAAAAAEGEVPPLPYLVSDQAVAELGALARAAAYPGVMDAVLRLLGAMVEFNVTNQKLVRCAPPLFGGWLECHACGPAAQSMEPKSSRWCVHGGGEMHLSAGLQGVVPSALPCFLPRCREPGCLALSCSGSALYHAVKGALPSPVLPTLLQGVGVPGVGGRGAAQGG